MSLSRKELFAKIAAENEARFSGLMEETKQEIANIEKISDAGERYLKIDELKIKIRDIKRAADGKIAEQAQGFRNPLAESGVLAGGIIGFGAFIVGGPFLVFALVGPVVGVSLLLGGGALFTGCAVAESKRENSINECESMLTKNLGDFFDEINALQKNMGERQESILDNNLSDLAASRHFTKLYKNFPDVEKAFTMASIRENFSPQSFVLKKLDKPDFKPKNG